MKKYLMIMLLALALSACDDEEYTGDFVVSNTEIATPHLEVNRTEISYAASGGTESISVVSNTTWTIVCSQDWCEPSALSGRDDAQIEIIASRNTTGEKRTGVIIVKAEGCKDLNITITQDAMIPTSDDNLPPS